MSKFDIKNIGDKFIVTKNNTPLVTSKENTGSKITEFLSFEDAQKYLEIMKMLDKKKNQHISSSRI